MIVIKLLEVIMFKAVRKWLSAKTTEQEYLNYMRVEYPKEYELLEKQLLAQYFIYHIGGQ